jgi:DNA invertase Pin-like site-specific DNA recombinase
MQSAIGYLRVSTQEQGRSGLGLEAQRSDIESFGKREGFTIIEWHQDVQTGGGADALLLRPGLATALKEARASRCPLIVSRLDRLSRNVHFITGLMEHKVHFMVAALGRDCDAFTLHIYASLAEQERKMIAERCRAAAAAARLRGRKYPLELLSKAQQRRFSALGRAIQTRSAIERAEAYRMHIEWALRQPGRQRRPIAYRAAAIALNERGIESPMGGRWTGQTLQRMVRRLGLNHPTARISDEVARARIYEICKQNPDATANQVKARMRLCHPVGKTRVYSILRDCRRDSAKNSPAQKKVDWYIDRWTHARARVCATWTRHRDFTAKEILQKLGPDFPMRLKWVQKILADCWRATAKLTPYQRRNGRRFPRPWGARYWAGKRQRNRGAGRGTASRPSAARSPGETFLRPI